MAQTQEDIRELEEEIALLEPETERLRKQIDGRGDTMHSVDQQIQDAKDERDRLMDQRKSVSHIRNTYRALKC